jgi:RNA polymerase primary sigma factor
MSFGLKGEEMSLEEIAKTYDLTRERVRQIKEKGIRYLKKSGAFEQFREYL